MDEVFQAFEFIGAFISSVYDFIVNIPDIIKNAFEYSAVFFISVWIDIKIASVEMSLSIARTLFSDYGVYDMIETSFNSLPSDTRYILHKFGVTTGLRIIFDSIGVSLVMRFFNW
ncbi:hypothetical protein [Vibrio jasicida]|uniref:hypothetical protein n=1 Tax=Vibrio jasicida TaxID=766224 RepID=UPI0003A00F5E|nr:hypothetical protein [Vibrio jasicida]